MRKRLIFMIPVTILFSLGSAWGQTADSRKAGLEQPVRQTQESPGAHPDSLSEGPSRETGERLTGPEGKQKNNKVKRSTKRVPEEKRVKSASSRTSKDLFGLAGPSEGEPGEIDETPAAKTESGNFVEQFFKERLYGEPDEEEQEDLPQKGAKLFDKEQPKLSVERNEDNQEDNPASLKGKKLYDLEQETNPGEEDLQ